MTDLVRRSDDSWVDLMGPVGQLASQISRTDFVPKAMRGQPAAVAASIMTGREMGLGPMTALRGIQIIEGTPSLTSEMLAARIFAAGHRIEWRAVTDEKVTVRIERGDGLSEAEVTWTMHDARRAGLAGKQVWQRYPRAMLRARALSECAQLACPDVALGLDVVAPVEANPAPPTTAHAGVTTVQVGRRAVDKPEDAPVGILEVAEIERVPREFPSENREKVDPYSSVTLQESAQEVEPRNAVTEASPALITPPQMRKLGALIGQWEAREQTRLDREQRRSLIRNMADVEALASAKDLTMEQASAAIDKLEMALEVLPPKAEDEP